MAKSKRAREHWRDEPDEHDFPAADAYLSLLFVKSTTEALVVALRSAVKVDRKAKDLLRASRLSVLPRENVHVAKDLKRVARGELLSPVLLVRGDGSRSVPLIVADGYHRICASYFLDEDADIPCRLVELP